MIGAPLLTPAGWRAELALWRSILGERLEIASAVCGTEPRLLVCLKCIASTMSPDPNYLVEALYRHCFVSPNEKKHWTGLCLKELLFYQIFFFSDSLFGLAWLNETRLSLPHF